MSTATPNRGAAALASKSARGSREKVTDRRPQDAEFPEPVDAPGLRLVDEGAASPDEAPVASAPVPAEPTVPEPALAQPDATEAPAPTPRAPRTRAKAPEVIPAPVIRSDDPKINPTLRMRSGISNHLTVIVDALAEINMHTSRVELVEMAISNLPRDPAQLKQMIRDFQDEGPRPAPGNPAARRPQS